MRISKELLLEEAKKTGFRPEILEKVWHLMNILETIKADPFLKSRLALKGGTALNLFIFDLPRLSVDIDLNYIGMQNREDMLRERPLVEKTLEAIFLRENFTIRRVPTKHAGGKWQLAYHSVRGTRGNLEVDLNFMFRVPLWDIQKLSSKLAGSHQIHDIPILDLHELAAGKLTALFDRNASRDLFDTYHLFTSRKFKLEKLRLAFILYIGMSSIEDLLKISPELLLFDEKDFREQMLPVLRNTKSTTLKSWKETKLQECKQELSILFPFTEREKEFLSLLIENGEIRASSLSDDPIMQTKIEQLPLLRWRLARASRSTK